jgi:hypothetical protein
VAREKKVPKSPRLMRLELLRKQLFDEVHVYGTLMDLLALLIEDEENR